MPEIATDRLGLAVRTEYRGQGVEARLLRALLEQAAANGIRGVSLGVESVNPALALYRRVGFEPAGRVGGAFTMIAETPRADVG